MISLRENPADTKAYWNSVFEKAITTTTLVRPYLARALLGWQPKKAGFIDGLPTYYGAYLAWEKTQN
jgi:hypothetical protein